ncbi:MAG: PepSY domain-containing protein [Bacteroidales bacterium]|nr:PepSY domain-containing protein [Bacteroidales bacterium]
MAPKKQTPWSRFRSVSFIIHKWLGIVSALVLTVVALSGTIYVFHDEVVKLLNRDQFYLSEDEIGIQVPTEILVQNMATSTGGKVRFLTIPAAENKIWLANVMREGDGRRGSTFMVNPYTGQFEEQKGLKGESFFFWVFRLHRWLLMDISIGRPIVGWATIIMIFLTLSGLIVWLPRKVRNIYKGLKIKWKGGAFRLTFDLHSTLGFYAAFFLLIMSITGLYWSFDWSRSAILSALGVEAPQRGGGGPGEKAELDSIGATADYAAYAEILAAADAELDYKGDYRLTLPEEMASSVVLTKSKTGFFAPSGSDRIEIDRVGALPVKIERFGDKPLNEQIASSIKALHTGEIFGLFTKILYFVSGLIASSLPVTGIILWIKKF